MEVDEPLIGSLVLTIHLPRRRWYGRMKSKITLETAAPFAPSVEIRHTILEAWIDPQPMYYEHRIPARIYSHAP